MGRVLPSTKPCIHCGKEFRKDPRNTWAYWSKAKYCSQACAGLAHQIRSNANRPSIEEAFWKHVQKSEGCWNWTWLLDKDGYGLFPYMKKMHRAHVVALRLDGRPVPAGKYGCHHCDNPKCVRPSHLYAGTPRQNVGDKIRRGRQPMGSAIPAAKLSEADVIRIRQMTGTHGEIASGFGVARATVSLIKERKTWRHVP